MPGLVTFLLSDIAAAAVCIIISMVAPAPAICRVAGHLIDRRAARRRVAAGEIRYLPCRRCHGTVDLHRARW